MIHTISLCNTCYKKIPATIFCEDGAAVMRKECDVHGVMQAVVDPSFQHVSNFYRLGTLGNNNSIIIHVEDSCNMRCPWCYYVPGMEPRRDAEFYDVLLGDVYRGFSLMLSGGEPTERDDYFAFTEKLHAMGWRPSTITNMLNIGDEKFFARTLSDVWVYGREYRFAMSFQHPKNYSRQVYERKLAALENIRRAGLQAACIMFSIQSLDELDFIRDFYDETRDLYGMLRIRTMFHNWGNKGEKRLYLSQLHEAFLEKFGDYCPVQSTRIEQSNIYCLYMETKEGRAVSLASAPTVENLDYHICSRPVYMIGLDLRCYPVPICQIVSEGIAAGWKDGFRITEGTTCSS